MKHYVCCHCGSEFAEDEVCFNEDKEYIDGRLMNINYTDACPYCGSENFDLLEDDDDYDED